MPEHKKAEFSLIIEKLATAFDRQEPFAIVVVDLENKVNNIYLSDPDDVQELSYILYRQAVAMTNITDDDLPDVFVKGLDNASQHGPN